MEIVIGLFSLTLTAILGQSTLFWQKLAKLERKIDNKQCPFGKCPLFERAKGEAAESREVKG